MSLEERITEDLLKSMKNRDAPRTSVLRMVKAALKNREIEKRGALSEEETIAVLKTQLKQRIEAIEHFEAGGRSELADKERGEKVVIESYLPEPISAEQMEKVVSRAIRETGASGPGDMGAVMKETMARLNTTGKTVDGKEVSTLVRAKLQALDKPIAG